MGTLGFSSISVTIGGEGGLIGLVNMYSQEPPNPGFGSLIGNISTSGKSHVM